MNALTLSPELSARLEALAHRKGQPVEALLWEWVASDEGNTSPEMPGVFAMRERLVAELEARIAAGRFEKGESLLDRYASPAAAALSPAELDAIIHEAATAWESEIDEFFDDNA